MVFSFIELRFNRKMFLLFNLFAKLFLVLRRKSMEIEKTDEIFP